MGIERVYMPILTVIFWIIMIGVVVLGACVVVAGAITSGIVVTEIFGAPQDNSKASVEIDPEAKRVLENNGLRSCQARPITSRFINKKGVKVNGKRYVVFCDPNNRYLSDCCYQE